MDDYDITEALIARIKAECPGFVYVDEAWFSEPIDDYNKQTPSALVYLAEDAAGPVNELATRQDALQSYGVFYVVEAGSTFRAQRNQVRKALFGWQPAGGSNVMAFGGGAMSEIRGRYAWWREYWNLTTLNAFKTARQRTMTV